MRERNRFLRGMTVWVGYTQTAVPYDRDSRFAGDTKYSPRKMVRFSLDAIFSFSHVPLQAATVLGFIFSAVAFLGIPVAIGFRIAGQFVPGITTLLLVLLLLGGIQLITVGLIGEYLGRVYDEVKGQAAVSRARPPEHAGLRCRGRQSHASLPRSTMSSTPDPVTRARRERRLLGIAISVDHPRRRDLVGLAPGRAAIADEGRMRYVRARSGALAAYGVAMALRVFVLIPSGPGLRRRA